MRTTIIGIDCATEDKKMGLALGYLEENKAYIEEVGPESDKSVAETLAKWISLHSPALLALDAPLGWPISLSQVLSRHKAGDPIRVCPNEMFRRATDRVVKEVIWKTPLDVGADKIGRTAHATLNLVEELRKKPGKKIPLAWEPSKLTCTSAIEVYPAATLKAHELPDTGYKGKGGHKEREEILKKLKKQDILRINQKHYKRLKNDDHALDAAICVLAGADFLSGQVIKPTDMRIALGRAKREGWIWVFDPKLK